jgi:hypothetical protein
VAVGESQRLYWFQNCYLALCIIPASRLLLLYCNMLLLLLHAALPTAEEIEIVLSISAFYHTGTYYHTGTLGTGMIEDRDTPLL